MNLTLAEVIAYWQAEFDTLAVCHCGELCEEHGHHSEHAPVWMPCPDTERIDYILGLLRRQQAGSLLDRTVNAYGKQAVMQMLGPTPDATWWGETEVLTNPTYKGDQHGEA